jgi:CBS domain-containing protein
MRELLTIRDVMTSPPHALRSDVPILEAIDFLLRHDVTSAPVVDASGRLVGVLSEKDCLRLVAEGAGDERDVPDGTAADWMTTEPVTLPPDMDVHYAAGRFLKEHFRRYPVAENGVLVGEIGRRDVLRAVQADLRAQQWKAAAQGA